MNPINREQLAAQLKQTIDQATGPIAIQAGHFAVLHDATSHELIPAVYQDIANPTQREAVQGNPYMGDFPLNTWELGAELVVYARAQGKQAGLLIVCNDWQWVEERNSEMTSADSNPFRAKFYARMQLPPSYLAVLKKYNLDTTDIIPFKNAIGDVVHPLFFSETKLRKRFSKQFAEGCKLSNACAQEYVPLLMQLQHDGIETMISCVPKTCLMPIKAGARIAKQDFGVKINMVNVFPGAVNADTFWTNAIIDRI